MSTLHVVLLAVFTVVAASLIFHSWRRRWLAERLAAENRSLADEGRSALDLFHDYANLAELIQRSARESDELDPAELRRRLASIREASRLLHTSYREAAGQRVERRAASEVVDAYARLISMAGTDVELELEGTLPYEGAPMHVVRVVENLLENAAREAALAGEPAIRVALTDARLEVENRVRDPSILDEAIYEAGVSSSGSTGLGLALARESAAAIGWTLDHRVDGDRVVFAVTARGGAARDAG